VSADDHLRGLRRRRDGLLHQPVEEQAAASRLASVEPEHELVQVEVELADRDAALMRANCA
jgi:hypothetical protein